MSTKEFKGPAREVAGETELFTPAALAGEVGAFGKFVVDAP